MKEELGMFDFRKFQNMTYIYAQTKGFLREIDLSSPIVITFILLMVEKHIIPEHQEIGIEKTMREHEVQFLDWFLMEKEFHNELTIGEMYLESESFKRDFGIAATGNLRQNVRALKEPIWGIYLYMG